MHRTATPTGARSGAAERLIARRELFEQLDGPARVFLISAPAGSGKTSLLRSWVAQRGLDASTAWVSVDRGNRDPRAFWLSILDSLRGTAPGAGAIREMTAAPGLEPAMLVERLHEDLASLDDPVLLVIDDLHDLAPDSVLEDIEDLIKHAPPNLSFALATRRDLSLGLHRLRLEGDLTEIRGDDLRFTFEESRAVLEASGLMLSDGAIRSLVAATEGWAAGLRLAALSLARSPDAEELAVTFSGRERSVAEYLIQEVLRRQPPEVSRLLLRTSMLERVCGPLADSLTGGSDSYRTLTELEDAGAFVVAIDPQRKWFRYHRLFADLLELELRRTYAREVRPLHQIAAEWFAEHGYVAEAIRHAQAAGSWQFAAELLADQWWSFVLVGKGPTARALLSAFPARLQSEHSELMLLAADARRSEGSLSEAERLLAVAVEASASVPEQRRTHFDLMLASMRLAVAMARNDMETALEQARLLVAAPQAKGSAVAPGEELRALALSNLAAVEVWTGRSQDAERHLDEAMEAARLIDSPLVELRTLCYRCLLERFRAPALSESLARQSIELAKRHGWEYKSMVGIAYGVLSHLAMSRSELDDAARWLDRTEVALTPEGEPAAFRGLHASRGIAAYAQKRYDEALSSFRAAERVGERLVASSTLDTRIVAYTLQVRVHLGEVEQVERELASLDPALHDTTEIAVTTATLQVANGDAEGATRTLAAIVEAEEPEPEDTDAQWQIHALLVGATARKALRDQGGATRALERALDFAESHHTTLPFLLVREPELLRDHLRLGTAHASLATEILAILSGSAPAATGPDAEAMRESISDGEARVLRYLPTNLTAPEIAAELTLSVYTIRTHIRNIYAKLGAHGRAEAVQCAREVGLLARMAG
jgi:LuxR family maltose regulon positive regulatory protein